MPGAQIGYDIATALITSSAFSEAALLLRQTQGARNQYGEWEQGAGIETPVALVQAPITGQRRATLPEGLRNEDVRTFWYAGDIAGVRYGLADGDRIVLGALGPSTSRFTGASRSQAERARDGYGVANPTWLTAYQGDTDDLIQLYGFGGHPVYQRYDEVGGHWADASQYRTIAPERWGSFTELLGVRIDPGNA